MRGEPTRTDWSWSRQGLYRAYHAKSSTWEVERHDFKKSLEYYSDRVELVILQEQFFHQIVINTSCFSPCQPRTNKKCLLFGFRVIIWDNAMFVLQIMHICEEQVAGNRQLIGAANTVYIKVDYKIYVNRGT